MSDVSFSEIYEALKSSPTASLSHADLVSSVAASVKSLEPEQVRKVVDAVASLHRLATRSHLSPADVSARIYDAARREDQSLVPEERGGVFKQRVSKALGLESLVAVKARGLQADVERVFCEARLLTDLRPVFGNDVAGAPTAMVIVHTLRLVYHEGPGGEHREIYIAVDGEDIERLREILERAGAKARALTSTMESAGIKVLGLT